MKIDFLIYSPFDFYLRTFFVEKTVYCLRGEITRLVVPYTITDMPNTLRQKFYCRYKNIGNQSEWE
jgi:hypothetical protein